MRKMPCSTTAHIMLLALGSQQDSSAILQSRPIPEETVDMQTDFRLVEINHTLE